MTANERTQGTHHQGQTFTVLGQGDTFFDYRNLAGIEGPVIFLGRAVQFEYFARSAAGKYFLTTDGWDAAGLSKEIAIKHCPVDDPSGPRVSPEEKERHLLEAALRLCVEGGAAGVRLIGCGRDVPATCPGIADLTVERINEPRIEKIIPDVAHFVCLEDLPAWGEGNIEQFRRLHPGWRVRIWRTIPADVPGTLRKAIENAERRRSRSAAMAYWLLHRYGGLYIDIDVTPIRSMEPLRRYQGFSGRTAHGCVSPAVMGSVPGNFAFDSMLEEVAWLAGPGNGAPSSLDRLRRRDYASRLLTRIWGKRDCGTWEFIILPRHYFHLFRDSQAAQRWRRADAEERERILARYRKKFCDVTDPYAVCSCRLEKRDSHGTA